MRKHQAKERKFDRLQEDILNERIASIIEIVYPHSDASDKNDPHKKDETKRSFPPGEVADQLVNKRRDQRTRQKGRDNYNCVAGFQIKREESVNLGKNMQ